MDLRLPKGERIIRLLARCGQCRVPRYSKVNPFATYRVAVNSYILGGGDGHQLLKEKAFNKVEGKKKPHFIHFHELI